MTALKPIENLRVRGVASERYPLNTICAHPDCQEPAVDPHHTFPRSQIGNDSWFVEINNGDGYDDRPDGDYKPSTKSVLPHVTGLCRAHHDQIEEHDAWIKLEDGVFAWYDAITRAEVEAMGEVFEQYGQHHSLWRLVGPLNPPPGSREGKPKRKKFTGEKRRQRKVISVKVPQDAQEDGGAVWDELMENVATKLEGMGQDGKRPVYYNIVDALNDWLTDE